MTFGSGHHHGGAVPAGSAPVELDPSLVGVVTTVMIILVAGVTVWWSQAAIRDRGDRRVGALSHALMAGGMAAMLMIMR